MHCHLIQKVHSSQEITPPIYYDLCMVKQRMARWNAELYVVGPLPDHTLPDHTLGFCEVVRRSEEERGVMHRKGVIYYRACASVTVLPIRGDRVATKIKHV